MFGRTFAKGKENFNHEIPINHVSTVTVNIDDIRICDGAYSPKMMDQNGLPFIFLGRDNACQTLKIVALLKDDTGKKSWTTIHEAKNGDIPMKVGIGMSWDNFNLKIDKGATHLTTKITCECPAKDSKRETDTKKASVFSTNGFLMVA